MKGKDETKLRALLGKRIVQLRKKAGYTSQETFAYDAEIPRALYGRFEKGANMTITSLYKIVQQHNISFEEFFSEGFESIDTSK